MTTIQDVARRAGVSPVTVSRVMNGAGNVNADTRARVEQVIRELGYVPNRSARSLRSRQTFTLGLILPDITNPFWTTIARGVEDTAQAEGYSVLMCNSDENLDKQTDYIHTVLQQRVDGVIIAPFDVDPTHLERLREQNIPIVLVDRWVDGWEGDTVRSDSVAGAYALTHHLLALGHRRIALVTGSQGTSTAMERLAGYALALDEAGLPLDPRLVQRGEFRVESGRAMAGQLLSQGLEPDAVVAANNVLAMGVLETLLAHRRRIPQEIAMVCFDELPDLARFYPFLTVASQPAYEIGINAGQLLLSRMKADAQLHPRHVLLPMHLILRHSCGRLLHRREQAAGGPAFIPDESEQVLVQPLAEKQLAHLHGLLPQLNIPAGPVSGWGERRGDPATGQLFQARLQSGAGLHVEERIRGKRLLEYGLQRSLPFSAEEFAAGQAEANPSDLVEFAWRLGIAAIPCPLDCLPDPSQASPEDLKDLDTLEETLMQRFPPPTLGECLNRVETYLRAAHNSRVAVYITLSSGLELARQIVERLDPCPANCDELLDRLANQFAAQQARAVRAVCDRFWHDLAFVVIREHLAPWQPAEAAKTLRRLEALAAPVQEHGLLLGLCTPGPVEGWLPALQAAGFGLLQGLDPSRNNLPALQAAARGHIRLAGGFAASHLAAGTREGVAAQVQAWKAALGEAALFGVSGELGDEVRPELFVAMSQAAGL